MVRLLVCLFPFITSLTVFSLVFNFQNLDFILVIMTVVFLRYVAVTFTCLKSIRCVSFFCLTFYARGSKC